MSRLLVIIAAEHVPSARALLEMAPFNLSAEVAEQTFVAAGSPTGSAPATHWWLSSEVTPGWKAACAQLCAQLPWAEQYEYDMATEPDFPAVKLADLGLQPLTLVNL